MRQLAGVQSRAEKSGELSKKANGITRIDDQAKLKKLGRLRV